MQNTILKFKNDTIVWEDIESPEPQTLLELREKYQFETIDIQDCDVLTQRPKIINRENYLFIILHVPIFNKENRRTSIAELDIFVLKDKIITLHPKEIPSIKGIQENIKNDEKGRINSTGALLYTVLKSIFEELLHKLDHISEKIDAVEEKIFDKENVVQEILTIKRDIINFRKIIRPQRTVLDPLTKKISGDFFNGNFHYQFKSVTSILIRVWNILENQKELIEVFENTNESILSMQLNKTMAFLATVSVLLLPISIIANFTPDSILLNNLKWTIGSIIASIILVIVALYAINKRKLLK